MPPGRAGFWPSSAWNCLRNWAHVSSRLWVLDSADRGGGGGWERETQSNEYPGGQYYEWSHFKDRKKKGGNVLTADK